MKKLLQKPDKEGDVIIYYSFPNTVGTSDNKGRNLVVQTVSPSLTIHTQHTHLLTPLSTVELLFKTNPVVCCIIYQWYMVHTTKRPST